MNNTITELRHENRSLKIKVGTLRNELLRSRDYQKRLIASYEAVVKEWQIAYRDLIRNGWKILFVKIRNRLKEV